MQPDVLSILSWLIEHPLVSILMATGAPILLTLVSSLRRRKVAPPAAERPTETAPAREAAPEIAASTPERASVREPEPTLATEPEPAPEPEPLAAPPPVRLSDRLRRTSDALVGRLGALLSGRSVDAELLEELEVLLMSADLGVRTADDLLTLVKGRGAGIDAEEVRAILHDAILEKLRPVELAEGSHLETTDKPHVILVLGVNGSGKTTTIGKLAARYSAAGKKVVLGAGDTFRAAAIEQLQIWGERVGCDVIAGTAGGDPSSVAFDAVKAAVARGADVCIIDTAGRLQTKKPLMEELGKLVRVIGRNMEGAPHETLLVLDSNTGQNAISQAKLFTEVAGVTGLVLTKLDGTAKGGVIVGLADEFQLPVKHVGVGEAIEDLRDFSAQEFVDALFER
jgi:fused signal recognition particle receptor